LKYISHYGHFYGIILKWKSDCTKVNAMHYWRNEFKIGQCSTLFQFDRNFQQTIGQIFIVDAKAIGLKIATWTKGDYVQEILVSKLSAFFSQLNDWMEKFHGVLFLM